MLYSINYGILDLKIHAGGDNKLQNQFASPNKSRPVGMRP
jgi:hypothetical protein